MCSSRFEFKQRNSEETHIKVELPVVFTDKLRAEMTIRINLPFVTTVELPQLLMDRPLFFKGCLSDG